MAADWAAHVRKYVPDADDAIIAGIVRYCGIALNKRDSALVSFSDKTELARVRDSFLKKKLGLKDPEAVLDASLSEVGKRMKGDRARHRVTVYYLLAESFGKLDIFAPKAKSGTAEPPPRAAAPKAKGKRPARPKAAVKPKVLPSTRADPPPAAPAAPVPAPAVAEASLPIAPPSAAQSLAAPQTPPERKLLPEEFGGPWWLLLIAIIAVVIWWL